jgi:hypothetical protein
MNPTIMCGTSTCGPIVTGNVLLGSLAACCPMDQANACGGTAAVLMGACLTKTAGTPDPSCPSIVVAGGVATLPGCCRPNRTCGADLTGAMLGCNDPTFFGAAPGGPCPTDAGPPGDSGPADTGPGDTGPGDTGPGDTGPGEGGGDSAPPIDAPLG